eukprot:s1093_g3.t18
MCRKHHPHPLEYTAAAYPVQKATLPLGRFKSIGWSIPAASWCREEKEQSRWTAFLLVLLLCHDHRQFCCWHCGRCCIAGGETSHMLLRRVLVESSIEPSATAGVERLPKLPQDFSRAAGISCSATQPAIAMMGVRRPSACRVHAALLAAQVMFGGGSVVGKLGVASFNPLLFALIREAVAGPLLLALALCLDGALAPLRSDVVLFTGMGICIFTNQAFFIIGDKLAGPVISSAWQCSQPIFTLSISLALGWEGASLLKTLGIAISFLGGAFMICYGQPVHSPGFAGNILLLLNCLGTSLYVILGKFAMDRYPSLSITAWSYINASVMMAIAAVSLNTQCWFIEFVCPPNEGSTAQCGTKPTSCTAWSVPPEVRGMARMQQFCHPSQQSQVLEHKFTRESHWVSIGGYGINGAYAAHVVMSQVYWILFNSMAAYFLITWANQYARAGFVLAYTALQPFTSTVLTAALVVTGRFPSLSLPGWNALGGLGGQVRTCATEASWLVCCASFGTARNNTSTTLHGRSARFHSTRRIRSCQMSVSLPEGGGDGGWLRLLRSTGDETSTQCSIWRCYNNQSMESLRLMQLLILRRRHSVGQDRRCMARIVQVVVALEENCLLQSHPVEKDGEHLSEDRDMLAPKAKEAGAEPAEARTLEMISSSWGDEREILQEYWQIMHVNCYPGRGASNGGLEHEQGKKGDAVHCAHNCYHMDHCKGYVHFSAHGGQCFLLSWISQDPIADCDLGQIGTESWQFDTFVKKPRSTNWVLDHFYPLKHVNCYNGRGAWNGGLEQYQGIQGTPSSCGHQCFNLRNDCNGYVFFDAHGGASTSWTCSQGPYSSLE